MRESMTDLSLVPLKDLCDEAIKRCTCGVIHLHIKDPDAGYVNWSGDYYQALGLCEDMKDRIRDWDEEETEEED